MPPSSFWVGHPDDWQPLFAHWAKDYPARAKLHDWTQRGGRKVRGLTLGDDGKRRSLRLLVGVPHAHEPAPTCAIVDFACGLLTGKRLDGLPAPRRPEVLENILITLLPDTNSQGRARSPHRWFDGTIDNEEFYKVAFGEAADGQRFGRYPEWRFDEHRPKRVGIVYEEVEDGVWVESNTSRKSTHTKAIDELYARYRYTHYLDMHQHEGYEACLLPAEFDDLSRTDRETVQRWSNIIQTSWSLAGVKSKGSYVPYRGQPRQQFFRDYWAGRCANMLRLTAETRNNRHTDTNEPTSLDHQLLSSRTALEGTITYLMETP